MGRSRNRVGVGSLWGHLPVRARQRGTIASSGDSGVAACPVPRPWGIRGKLWAGGMRGGGGWRRWTPSTSVRGRLASSAAPAGLEDSRTGSGRPCLGGATRAARGARAAGRSADGGGGAGACALRPCHIGMSRSAERRRCRRRLRRSAGGGGRGELPAAPLRQAQQEGGRERADASGASEKSARAGKREEGKKESEREREESERLRSARAKTPGR